MGSVSHWLAVSDEFDWSAYKSYIGKNSVGVFFEV